MLATLALLGCGDAANAPTVVRVGHDAIGRDTVAHWTRVIERGGLLGKTAHSDQGTPRQRALAFLISSAWLAGEAERLGLAVPSSVVDKLAAERSAASGETEFDESLHASGQTLADIKHEIRAELALDAIRRHLDKQATLVSEGEIAAFYRSQRRMFVQSEGRDVDLIETFTSRAAAAAFVKRNGSGPRFAKKAIREKPSRASIARRPALDKKAVLRAIFAARPGVVSRPMMLSGYWIVFLVRRIVPARLRTLAEVRGEIIPLLRARRRKHLAAQFDREYKARWTAQTSCRSGYVVQGCAQFSGPIANEENPFAIAAA